MLGLDDCEGLIHLTAKAQRLREREDERGQVFVVRADATRPPPSREACDLVLLDPPYRSGQAPAAMTALAAAGWMTPGCIVTVECAHNEDLPPPPGFAAIDERRYGAAKIVILKRTA